MNLGRRTHTRTFVELGVSAQTYQEIAAKLREAGYDHAFVEVEKGPPAVVSVVIDMQGIALALVPEPEVRMAVNPHIAYWSIEEDPGARRLPAGLIVRVDGQEVSRIRAWDVHEGYVRAACTGQKPGCAGLVKQHLDQETNRLCEVVHRGKVEVGWS